VRGTGRRRRAALAAALGLTLLLAGCSTTRDLAPTGAASDGSLGGDENPSPGITDSTVKIGVIYTDTTTISRSFGFVVDDPGDYQQQLKILTEWIDANGGMGGRRVKLVTKEFNASEDSPATEQALCNAFTKDDEVFAAVLTGQFQANARPCYQSSRTVAVDSSDFLLDREALDELAPYVWSPDTPVMDGFVPAYVSGLEKNGFFEGAQKVGVVAADTPVARRLIDDELKPALSDLGFDDLVTGFADASDATALGGALAQITLDFQGKGVDRVLFLGGGQLAPFFATNLNTYNYFPRLGLSSFDNPLFITRNSQLYGGEKGSPLPVLEGSLSFSFRALADVEDDELPFPDSFGESQCLAIYGAGGLDLTNRSDAKAPLRFCSSLLFLKSALDKLTGQPVSPHAFGQAAASLGQTWQSPLNYATVLDPQHLAGAAAYRITAYDQACACYKFTGGTTPFPGVVLDEAADESATDG
jgi:hypothetical protein